MFQSYKTKSIRPQDVQRTWWHCDADGVVLGRLAVQVASYLRGKHKVQYSPHVDCGDFVVVTNASQVVLTGNKLEQKKAYSYSGYPGGLRTRKYADFLATDSEKLVVKAVRGMLPKNKLGRQLIKKLKVYSGPQHPHEAQQPTVLSFSCNKQTQVKYPAKVKG